MKKALSIVLLLSGLMPLYLGSLILISSHRALAMLKMPDTPDVAQAIILFGDCLVPLAILQLIAAWWVWRNNWSGVILARWTGALIIFSGTILYTSLHRPDLAVTDVGKGLLIFVLAMLSKK